MTIRKLLYYLSHWESWHWFAKYIVISPAWLRCTLQARSLWFFTPTNPSIQFGGYVGEKKSDVYRQLPPGTTPTSVGIDPSISLAEVMHQMRESQLEFPVAVKPESGLMGFMFRKIENEEHLKQYHQHMTATYLLQEFVDYPLEVSVFYYRFPGRMKGTITGFVRKDCMYVTGDGQSTLWQLIEKYRRAQFRHEEMKAKHGPHLSRILTEGETYVLSHALNLSRGGKLVSLEHEKDERLLSVFDDLSHYSGFYYGRYDIRCNSIDELKEGRNYKILEFNGTGAEPHHVYGNGFTFWQACSILVQHWNILSRIARYNHKLGVPYWGHAEGWRFLKKALRHVRQIKTLDKTLELSPLPLSQKLRYETTVLTKEELSYLDPQMKQI